MTSVAHLLEDFTMIAVEPGTQETSHAGETELLDSFEQGYKAGWDDAIKAKSENASNISDDLARNLRDLSFTFHEARAAMMADVTSVLDEIVAAAIPDILRATMGERLKSELQTLIDSRSAQPAAIRVNPDDLDAVSSALPEKPDLPVALEASANVSRGRVEFHVAGRERALDINETAKEIINAVAGLNDQTATELSTLQNKDVAYG